MTDNNGQYASGRIQRRRFVKALGGAAAVGVVAGCTGDGGDGAGGTDGGDGGTDGGDGGDTDGDGGDGDGDGGTDFPQDDILLVIPYGAGGYDVYTRLVAPYVEENLPNDVGVQPENRPGAGGVTPTTEVYNAEPDGHTLMIFNVQSFVRSQIQGQGDYRAEEMTPIAQIAQNTRCIGVAENSGIDTWEDFVQGVQNEEVTFGATGATSGGVIIPGVVGELGGLYPAENVIENRVDFDGKGDHATAMERGDVQVMAGSYSSVLPYVEDGPVEMLMVTTTEDSPPDQTPDANTFGDVDIESPDEIENTITSFRVFVGPPEIPEERAEILRDAFEQAINDEEFQAEAEEADRPVDYGDAEAVEEVIATSQEQWSELSHILEE